MAYTLPVAFFLYVDGQHHAGDTATQSAYKTDHGGADVRHVIQKQDSLVKIGGHSQTGPRFTARYGGGIDLWIRARTSA